ncbi:hypothetical protein Y032_0019g3805 [Ancylostoma ceylanicum]|uniref:Uncharacterized protein n=1 Tax=Ancylostoma ceylanicum TaxID=53326 RepID=A0A016V3V5_9BILA|nr:hypothetical protein Y032_0019g3805 [Ancylostoma ceylanicum]
MEVERIKADNHEQATIWRSQGPLTAPHHYPGWRHILLGYELGQQGLVESWQIFPEVYSFTYLFKFTIISMEKGKE